MIQPARLKRITRSGAIENAEKKASAAPVVDALSEFQCGAAQLKRPGVTARKEEKHTVAEAR
jgi:hypothetical protein